MPALGNMGASPPGWMADLPDRYEVVREHARGGMAVVYLARDRKHDRDVALKVLSPELAAGVGAERFLREIQTAAHLNHPHIVPLLDSGLAGGLPYYVMPFVEGESLRDRISSAGPLPTDEALRIVRDVAEALRYAHRHGVVHRDIKPGNVLLTADAAVVTDFGIAAAIDQAPEEHLTRTGLTVGSVGYMSPEQASGDVLLDGRSDQFSLACVMYEMLTGRRPFEGNSARAVLGRQVRGGLPPLSTHGKRTPPHIAAILTRALASDREARYPSLGEFIEALNSGTIASRPAPRSLGSWVTLSLLALVTSSVVLVARGTGVSSFDASDAEVGDPLHFAIFPFRYNASPGLQLNEEERTRRVIAAWGGISTVEPAQLHDASRRSGATTLTAREASRLAASLGAGRLIVGQVDTVDNRLSIETRLYSSTGELLYTASGIADSSSNLDAVFDDLIGRILFRGAPPGAIAAQKGQTPYPALQSFHNGMIALEAWDLRSAAAYFDGAVRLAPTYGRAQLWLALTRAWNDEAPARWLIPAKQADANRVGLTDRDSIMVEAIASQVDGDFGKACEFWRSLTRRQERDYAGWYGLALCLTQDDAILDDPSTPSGRRFRASRDEALHAYTRAFQLLPAILETFNSNSYRSLRKLFYLTTSNFRIGVDEATGNRYWARPTWVADSLAFVPYPAGEFSTGDLEALDAAVDQMRRRFTSVASSWVSSAPADPRALGALALGLAMGGDAGALDTLKKARSLPGSASDSLELAELEVWLRFASGMPSFLESLKRAGELADSLLASGVYDTGRPEVGSALAVLLGRASLAAGIARRIPYEPAGAIAPGLQSDAHALAIFAVTGESPDSVGTLGERVSTAIRQLPAEQQPGAVSTWLVRPALLAFEGPRSVVFVDSEWEPLLAAQRALVSGDSTAFWRIMESAAEVRGGISPFYLTPDMLFVEANLLAMAGHQGAAEELLDPSLTSLYKADLDVLSDPVNLGSLLRAIQLRSHIAEATGEPTESRRWKTAISLVRSGGASTDQAAPPASAVTSEDSPIDSRLEVQP